MTKARDLSKLLSTANGKIEAGNVDIPPVSFENIVDTGTAGTKVASGTTAQRGSTTGQTRYNNQTGNIEYYDGSRFKVLDAPPLISSISPSTITNAQTAIVITGAGFKAGANVVVVSSAGTTIQADSVTYVNSTTINATFTISTDTTYFIKVTNQDGYIGLSSTALLTVSDNPVWSTTAGALSTATSSEAYTTTVSATSDSSITYSLLSGSLPTGITLNSSTGVISGTSTVGSTTTYNFTIRATDQEAQVSDRAFSIMVASKITFTMKLYGAGGDGTSYNYSGNSRGGHGGYVEGTYILLAGTTLAIAVDQGSNVSGSDQHGGYTGGVNRYSGGYAGVFNSSISVANAILIAGGGGSASGVSGRDGGDGGGTNGSDGTNGFGGSGGTQSGGNAQLQGGVGGSGPDCGGAGGGGWWGGTGGTGGGFTNHGSGGGGSGYVLSEVTSVTNTQGGANNGSYAGGTGGVGSVEILVGGTRVFYQDVSGTYSYTLGS
jgi:hypothetical protein